MFLKHCKTDPSLSGEEDGVEGQGHCVALVTPMPGLQRTFPGEDRMREARGQSLQSPGQTKTWTRTRVCVGNSR